MDNQEANRICESCGTSNASEAQFCGRCGHELLDEAAGVTDAVFQSNPDAYSWQYVPPNPPAAPEPEYAGSNLGELEGAAQAPVEETQQKRCSWCGNMNPWTVAVCESCGARFPVPGQDEAFRRAAEERLRQEEATLDILRQRRRGWRRFFTI